MWSTVFRIRIVNAKEIPRIIQKEREFVWFALSYYWITVKWRQSAKNIPTVQQNNSHHNLLLHLHLNLNFFFSTYVAISFDQIKDLWMNFDILFISYNKNNMQIAYCCLATLNRSRNSFRCCEMSDKCEN